MTTFLRRYPDACLGFLGALLVTAGSYGLSDVPRIDSTLADLGLAPMTYGHGKTLSGFAFWTGIALMVIAWVRIGRDHERMSLRATVATIGAWTVPLMVAIPTFSRDVYAYLGQAWVLKQGFDPYTDGPAHSPGPIVDSMAQIWAPTTSPYSPGFMLVLRGVVEVTGENVFAGVMLIRIALLPGLLLTLWAVPRIAAHFGASRRLGLWLVLLNPMLLIHLVGGPHLELLMMGFLAAGVALALTGRHVAGLVVLGLAISVKITAGIAIPFIMWIWIDHLRRARAAEADPDRPLISWRDRVGVFLATAAIPSAVFGVFTLLLGLGVGWMNGLAYASRIINPFTIPVFVGHIVTYVAAPFTVLNLQEVLVVTRTIGSVALAAILVYLWWRSRHDERSAMAGMSWAMLALLLLEPSTLPWYYTWVACVVVAFTLPMWVRQVVVGVSTFYLIVFQPDDSILFYKPIETLLALALAALAAVSLRKRDPLRLRDFGSLLVRG
ncbi:polyprenol phosphomannose-dependent alpha 1,6 mannosyltransferase MptB [Gordonia sp. (in: high G+C Gram-positive bacteria)]|uniref:polyprenol phosphomannose-dependent alpha 1,6 mannosyltransferase MptB n=1 Tax=Gordonia sp. (in: high G+C Gram-positive bacteria) TaxID=84139 RepID=UPI0016B24E0A|nr:polyprenol phosphomannose-dependent alpha 1,6 mannosyltransferase MptB [Gordonia sp. (in: high G+C Gram-positive bacteria)]NLG44937.1 polyprenol phosphomannose-dependent alpha 1,6 mannosyltransferase MptB [Gordonia sp. (in: high G+C Gram-positive bacteria)]